MLSGGERNDAVGFGPVWQGLPEPLSGLVAAVMDKAYDSNAIRHFPGVREIEAVIPPKPAPECSYRGSNRTEAIDYDKEKYERREKVERFFNKLKQFRRIATRYEILCTDLKYPRFGRVRQGQDRAEVQIVGKHGISMFHRPLHDGPVAGACIPYRGPMDRRPPVAIRNGNPIGRQIHVHQEVDAHGRASGTSRSSTLHAA